jgi:two-component system, OmpR family, phosphate regulon sensor histidine kinase PhoR
VNLLSFLSGLAIGGFALLIYRDRLRRQLDAILPDRPITSPRFSISSRLRYLLNDFQQQQQQQQDAITAWKNVIHQGPLGYLLIDEDNQLVDFNSQALSLLNIQLDVEDYQAATPRLLLELVRSYDLDQLIEQARDRQQVGQKDWPLYPVSADVENVAATIQQVRHLRGYAFPLTNDYITVLLESRQEEMLLSQQRDRWASDVAHELKTPLTSIRLVAETLQNRVDPALRQWIDRLLAEVIRLSTLVQEILDLSQLESHPDRQLPFSHVDLPQMIQSAWQSLDPLAQDHNITLHYEGPSYLVIQADESRLFRVMLNLFDNSLKYAPANQAIQVKVELLPQSPQIQIDLIDAGPGFPEADLDFIFERFYRGDPSRTRLADGRRPTVGHHPVNQSSNHAPAQPMTIAAPTIQAGSGSGLGLAIVRQIIDLHSGSITARNHPATGGAWIQIRLPQQTPPANS